jgi:hypothetical protein
MSNTIEVVKGWFQPLKVLESQRVNRHLESLYKYGDNLVNSSNQTSSTAWKKIFRECLIDVIDVTNDVVKSYENNFKVNCGKTDDELNKMTKKDFVMLFAQVLNPIFVEEKEPHSDPKGLDNVLSNDVPNNLNSDDCPPGQYRNSYTGKCHDYGDYGGGSKKKSHKRSTRNPRRSRRHRRGRTSTHKYKNSLYRCVYRR